MKCQVCGNDFEAFDLKKCPICHKMFCPDCAQTKGGVSFCSRFCKEFFFYGQSEEEE